MTADRIWIGLLFMVVFMSLEVLGHALVEAGGLSESEAAAFANALLLGSGLVVAYIAHAVIDLREWSLGTAPYVAIVAVATLPFLVFLGSTAAGPSSRIVLSLCFAALSTLPVLEGTPAFRAACSRLEAVLEDRSGWEEPGEVG